MAEGLCTPEEHTYFSCPIKSGKTLSVCGQKTADSLSWLQYRFGTKQKIELSYPTDAKNIKPGEVFSFSHYMRGSPFTQNDNLSFTNGSTTYNVTVDLEDASVTDDGKELVKYGVEITTTEKPDNPIFISCTKPVTNHLDELQGLIP